MFAAQAEIFTVGHSTHDIESFLELLSRHVIELLVDVRRFPGSRRHPQFNSDALAQALAGRDIGYLHVPDLGGRRKPRAGSANAGWEVEAFQGYADHMQTEEFATALGGTMQQASARRTVVMCAEAPWWKCHRRMISDALVVRGWKVHHIMPGGDTQDHRLTDFAVVDGEDVIYPPVNQPLALDAGESPQFPAPGGGKGS